MDENRLDIINNNIDEYLPLPDTRAFTERDVIGSMLINGSIKTKYTVYTEDFRHIRLRGLYRHLINLSDEHGSFEHDELLTDNLDNNKYILNLMNVYINANIDVKTRFLIKGAIWTKINKYKAQNN